MQPGWVKTTNAACSIDMVSLSLPTLARVLNRHPSRWNTNSASGRFRFPDTPYYDVLMQVHGWRLEEAMAIY